jgi:hypothetical protein
MTLNGCYTRASAAALKASDRKKPTMAKVRDDNPHEVKDSEAMTDTTHQQNNHGKTSTLQFMNSDSILITNSVKRIDAVTQKVEGMTLNQTFRAHLKAKGELAPRKPALTLTTLPVEILNTIYELVVSEDKSIVVRAYGDAAPTPALAKVCRQIRYPALRIYFELNRFHLIVFKFDPVKYEVETHVDLPAVSPYMHIIKKFEISICAHNNYYIFDLTMPGLKEYDLELVANDMGYDPDDMFDEYCSVNCKSLKVC